MRFIFIFLLILLINFSNIRVHGQIDQNLLKGLASWELNHYDSAVFYFNSAPESMKTYPVSYLYYGISLLESGQPEMALNEFMKAEKIEKGIASFQIAKMYAISGNIKKTLEYLDLNLRSKYKVPEKTILLDSDLQKFENDPEWKQFWKDSNYYSSLDMILNESEYLINSGDFTEALVFINDNLNKSFRKSPLYAKRSMAYSYNSNYRMAIEDLTKAIDGDRNNIELFEKRAALYMKDKKYKPALDDYDFILKRDPYRLYLYPLRAIAKNYNDLYESAISDMDFFLTYFPKDHSAWYQLGRIHFSNQQYLPALNCFNKALQLNKGVSEYYEARGETYLQTKTFRYANNDFGMALDINPQNPYTYLKKGETLLYLGNVKEACFCFARAKELGAAEANEFLQKHCN